MKCPYCNKTMNKRFLGLNHQQSYFCGNCKYSETIPTKDFRFIRKI